MGKYVLIACCKTKREEPKKFKACDLYVSDLFKKSMAYAKSLTPDNIFILSAKYDLLELDNEITYYEEKLSDKPIDKRKEWAETVIKKLSEITDLQNDEFIFLAGNDYIKDLERKIKFSKNPLKGKRPGERKKWLKENTP
ncbi:MAG: hypothetical protein LBC85_12270 [Fibromonadaceae bacterium]|jgi:hypothetical protein|nr:hypothetical protein [Fibromonadaceae bacterium]